MLNRKQQSTLFRQVLLGQKFNDNHYIGWHLQLQCMEGGGTAEIDIPKTLFEPQQFMTLT
jgi:hypothetical protein